MVAKHEGHEMGRQVHRVRHCQILLPLISAMLDDISLIEDQLSVPRARVSHGLGLLFARRGRSPRALN